MAAVDAETLAQRVGSVPAAVVVPTVQSISPDLKRILVDRGDMVLTLNEFTSIVDHELVGNRAGHEVLAPLRDKLLANLVDHRPGRVWILPADAKWEQLTFDFTAEHVVKVSFRGDTRSFEPDQFNMRNKNNGRPNLQWSLLRSLSVKGGSLTWSDPQASTKIKKQKQLLSRQLMKLFGLEQDPILWRKEANAYQTRFVIRDSARGSASARRYGQ